MAEKSLLISDSKAFVDKFIPTEKYRYNSHNNKTILHSDRNQSNEIVYYFSESLKSCSDSHNYLKCINVAYTG